MTENGQNVTWLSGENEVLPSVLGSRTVYQIKHGMKAVLHITDKADFDSSGVFTCYNEATTISISISVEGMMLNKL